MTNEERERGEAANAETVDGEPANLEMHIVAALAGSTGAAATPHHPPPGRCGPSSDEREMAMSWVADQWTRTELKPAQPSGVPERLSVGACVTSGRPARNACQLPRQFGA
jgi:hypothetical protein